MQTTHFSIFTVIREEEERKEKRVEETKKKNQQQQQQSNNKRTKECPKFLRCSTVSFSTLGFACPKREYHLESEQQQQQQQRSSSSGTKENERRIRRAVTKTTTIYLHPSNTTICSTSVVFHPHPLPQIPFEHKA